MAGTLAALLVAISMFTVPRPATLGTTPVNAHHALLQFEQGVARYLHIRELQEPIAIDCLTADRELIQRGRDKLAAAIRDARGWNGRGEIFTDEVAALFRQRLDRAYLTHTHDAAMFPFLDAEFVTEPIVVNGRLPWAVSLTPPPFLLAVLPPVTDGLEYRLAGRDLILWDAQVDLIVDILPDAVRVN